MKEGSEGQNTLLIVPMTGFTGLTLREHLEDQISGDIVVEGLRLSKS